MCERTDEPWCLLAEVIYSVLEKKDVVFGAGGKRGSLAVSSMGKAAAAGHGL